jgi:hypothetical protein
LVVAYPPSHPLFAEVVTALDDLERPGFVTRIRHLRQIKTPLGFRTEQTTNAYRVHEPTSGLRLLATALFAPESNSWTASAHIVESLNGAGVLNPESSPLHRVLARLERLFKKGAAPDDAAKGYPMNQ